MKIKRSYEASQCSANLQGQGKGTHPELHTVSPPYGGSVITFKDVRAGCVRCQPVLDPVLRCVRTGWISYDCIDCKTLPTVLHDQILTTSECHSSILENALESGL